jgi:CopG family transcriptional regulator, nickel-responsive regulator
MQRFTISLNDVLAEQFDGLVARKGYVNRSEAVRDLIREQLGSETLDAGKAKWCVANVSFVYDHHERMVTERVLGLQHANHDLVMSSLHTHLDHSHCLESVILRGPTSAVVRCAEDLVALKGVHHGKVHLVPLAEEAPGHHHSHGTGGTHKHLKPVA